MEKKIRKILAIDDNMDNLVVLQALLTVTFPDVYLITAQSGKAGLESCLSEHPDVILLDIIMPGMDGYEVCRNLKSNAKTKSIPVIMITAGKSDSDSRIKALDSGADAFLSKPVDESELTAQIRAMFRIKDSEDQKLDEKERLAKQIQERTRSLQQELVIRKKAEKELHETLQKLEKSVTTEVSLLKSLRAEIEERKHLEKVIRESETKYRTLTENLPDIIARFDPDFRHTYVNPAIQQITGFAPEDYIGKKNEDLPYNQENLQLWNESLREVFSIGKQKHIEFHFKAHKGTHYFSTLLVPEFDEAGGVSSVLSVARNITERKLAEEALMLSEERFRYISSSISDISYSCVSENNENYYLDWVFGATERIMGYSTGELIEMKCWGKLVVEQDIPLFKKHILEVKSGTSDNCQLRLNHKNGSIIWIEASSKSIIKNEVLGVACLYGGIVDITESKKAELELQEAFEFNRYLLQTIPYGMDIVDEEGTILFLSENLLLHYGADAIGKKCWDLYRDSKKKCDSCPLSYHITTGQTKSMICDGMLGGRIFEISYTGIVFKGRNATLEIFRDITEQKIAEDTIQLTNADLDRRVRERTIQLEIANKELESFSYSVSHDLRAPLRGIDGWSLALLEDFGDQLDEKAMVFLHRVRSETQKMGMLIDDLLKLSHISRSEMKRVEVDLSKMAGEICDKMQQEQPDREVKVTIQEGIQVIGDPMLLESVLTNLLNNAWKFTGRKSFAEIEFGTQERNGQVVYFIKDNGAGFDMEYANKLFGAFQRLHKVTEFPGTGIGLATVQRIILRHEGRVWAESQENVGSTFYFTLNETSHD